MKLKITLLLLSVLFLTTALKAENANGGTISVKAIDSNRYEVTIDIFRDCFSWALNNVGLYVRAGSTYEILTPEKKSIEAIPVFSPRQNNNYCTPQNTSSPASRGLERHTFIDTVDFTKAPFNTGVWDTACEIQFHTYHISRGGFTTTISPYSSFVGSAIYNRCLSKTNNTPIFKNDPVYEVQVNKPFYYKYSVDEPDGDSLSFHFTGIKTNYNAYAAYNISTLCSKPFSNQMQMTPLLPNACGPYGVNPNVYPPVGIYLNDSTGEFIFTPTKEDEVGIITVELKEWRKDTAGTPQIISKTHYEMAIQTKLYPKNNASQIITTLNHTFIAGQQNCINIYFKDDAVPPETPDTLQVFWTDTIPGASFSVDTTQRTRPSNFCWTPSCSDVRSDPYMFTVNVRDGFIPLEVRVSRVFRVTVKQHADFSLGADKHICEGDSITLSTGTNNASWLWSTMDTTATIKAANSGDYWVRAISFCGDTLTDTIHVSTYAKPTINLPKDSIGCIGDSIRVGIKAPNALSYHWNINVSSDSITIDSNGNYKVTVVDKYCGVFEDSISAYFINPPTVNFGIDKPKCKVVNETLTVNADSITSIIWSTGDSVSTTINPKVPDIYWVVVENNCGIATDTVNYSDTTVLNLNLGQDTLVCDDNDIELISNVLANEYSWSTNESTKSINVTSAGSYLLSVSKCTKTSTDTIEVSFDETPIVNLGMDQQVDTPFSQILDAGVDNASYLWNTNETSKTVTITQQGEYWVKVDNDCGTDTDTINIIANSVLGPNAIAQQIKVYPNPTSQGGVINIDFKQAANKEVKIELVDLTGKAVYTDKTKINGNTTYSFNPGKLPSGIYFLQLSTPQGKATIRVIIEN